MEKDEHPPTIDACRAYALYREAGKFINLGDWYGAFEQGLEEEEQEEDTPERTPTKRSKGKVATTSTQSRRKRSREDPDADEDEDRAILEPLDDETKDRIKHARFISAVGDLGFLGLLSTTKRKPEHVGRVVW